MTEPSPPSAAPIADRYEPAAIEARWYPEWQRRGYFRAEPDHPGPPYCIVIPPPNVTGSLHLGHALVRRAPNIGERRKGQR
jgi:valyl-tRNA synthetase